MIRKKDLKIKFPNFAWAGTLNQVLLSTSYIFFTNFLSILNATARLTTWMMMVIKMMSLLNGHVKQTMLHTRQSGPHCCSFTWFLWVNIATLPSSDQRLPLLQLHTTGLTSLRNHLHLFLWNSYKGICFWFTTNNPVKCDPVHAAGKVHLDFFTQQAYMLIQAVEVALQ